MGVMTIREFNANISRVIARVEAGETIDISKGGKIVAELRPKPIIRDAAWHRAATRLDALMAEKFGPYTGSITQEDKYGDADL